MPGILGELIVYGFLQRVTSFLDDHNYRDINILSIPLSLFVQRRSIRSNSSALPVWQTAAMQLLHFVYTCLFKLPLPVPIMTRRNYISFCSVEERLL